MRARASSAMPVPESGVGAFHAAFLIFRIRSDVVYPPDSGGAQSVMGRQELGRQEVPSGAALYARSRSEMAREAFSSGMTAFSRAAPCDYAAGTGDQSSEIGRAHV